MSPVPPTEKVLLRSKAEPVSVTPEAPLVVTAPLNVVVPLPALCAIDAALIVEKVTLLALTMVKALSGVVPPIAPAVIGLTGWAYGGTAVTLGIIFMAMAIKVARSTAELASDMTAEKQLFKFSLLYLACLFGALVADVWLA
jgi:heme O synthase-like polyprenyltransferase